MALPGYTTSADDPAGLLLWLDSAVSLQPDLLPRPDVVEVELGRDSLACRRALTTLSRLWEEVRTLPEVQLKRRLWADFLEMVYGSSVDAGELFLQHTYLTIVAKTIATRVLAIPLPEPADLLSGRAFDQAGISGRMSRRSISERSRSKSTDTPDQPVVRLARRTAITARVSSSLNRRPRPHP